MPRALIAFEHWEREQAGEPEKTLVNMYGEEDRTNPNKDKRLVTTPGTLDRDTGDVIQGNIRALAQADAFASGNILILDGTTLRTRTAGGTFGTISGTVAGSDRADVAISQTELAILSGGTVFVSGGSSIAAVTDGDFPAGITSVAVMAQRLLMTAASGRFWFSSVLDFDDLTSLYFYTAEGSPDNLVAVRVWAESALMFGTKTLELWFADGANSSDPFSRASSVVPVGCLARDTIAITSQGPVWVDPENNVVALNGASAPTISPAWLCRLIAAETSTDLMASTYKAEGQEFYCLNGLAFCCVYNLTTGEWHKRKTLGSNTWAWVRILTAGGKQYVSKRTGTAFMELSRAYPTDEQANTSTMGNDIVREWTAHIPISSGTQALGTLIIEGTKGAARASGDGSDPVHQMRLSFNQGNTWTAYRDRKTGVLGAYNQRSVWHRCGTGKRPQAIAQFKVSEPVKFSVEGVSWGETI
jgi:hypothetical protein